MNANHYPLYFTSNVTSIHGGRVGLSDKNTLVGPHSLQRGVNTALTTTSPSTRVPSHGFVAAGCSGSSQGPVSHTLDDPIPGVDVTIALVSTSTGGQHFAAPSGASIIWTTLGTTVAQVNLTGQGGHVTLCGISTSQWVVGSYHQTTDTTST